MLEVDQQFRNQGKNGVKLALLSLVNRRQGERLIENLKIERVFFNSAELNKYGMPEGLGKTVISQSERLVCLTGLEDLMAIQRRSLPYSDARGPVGLGSRIDSTLSGLFLIIRYQQLIDRYLGEHGLPFKMSLVIQMDHAEWPMEVGIYDFGPQARRQIVAADDKAKSLEAASKILAKRTAERRTEFQAEVNRMFAEYREIYRILRMFPFYRFRARNKLAELFNSQLQLSCKARELPENGWGWRMGKGAFEDLLRRLADSMNPPSVDSALDPVHVDLLHERWVKLAKDKDFNLGSSPVSLFELNLAWALKFGGPFVQTRDDSSRRAVPTVGFLQRSDLRLCRETGEMPTYHSRSWAVCAEEEDSMPESAIVTSPSGPNYTLNIPNARRALNLHRRNGGENEKTADV